MTSTTSSRESCSGLASSSSSMSSIVADSLRRGTGLLEALKRKFTDERFRTARAQLRQSLRDRIDAIPYVDLTLRSSSETRPCPGPVAPFSRTTTADTTTVPSVSTVCATSEAPSRSLSSTARRSLNMSLTSETTTTNSTTYTGLGSGYSRSQSSSPVSAFYPTQSQEPSAAGRLLSALRLNR